MTPPAKKTASAAGRALAGMRKNFRGGRPPVFYVCRFCKRKLSALEIRTGRCSARKASNPEKGLPHGAR
jgi:hypothetical protein